MNGANRAGITAIVKQQFEVGRQVLAAGLMPILEPEVNIKSATRGECDQILKEEILKALDAMPGTDKLMLKLSIPANAGPVRRTGRSSARAFASLRCRAATADPMRARNWRRIAGMIAELQPGPSRGFARADERCRVRRGTRRGDWRYLRGIGRQGFGLVVQRVQHVADPVEACFPFLCGEFAPISRWCAVHPVQANSCARALLHRSAASPARSSTWRCWPTAVTADAERAGEGGDADRPSRNLRNDGAPRRVAERIEQGRRCRVHDPTVSPSVSSSTSHPPRRISGPSAPS